MLTRLRAHQIGDEQSISIERPLISILARTQFCCNDMGTESASEARHALELSVKGLKVLFDFSTTRDLIVASASYDPIFDEQVFKMVYIH